MPQTKPAAAANRLLTALPQRERRRVLAACRSVELTYAEILAESGKRIRHVYFPTASFISQSARDGRGSVDVGLIGYEGMLGTSLVLGTDVAPLGAVVQGGGPALRMDAAQFRNQLAASPALLRQLKRYIQVLMGQLAQSTACARFHSLEARLGRLLLMTQDRAQSERVRVTHEVVARRLGVRRAGVTMAATALQRRGLIGYRRGAVTIFDRGGLEATACDCYAADNATYGRLMDRSGPVKSILAPGMT